MTYHYTTRTTLPFDEAVDAIIDALKARGFGVLTRIDVQATLREKIGAEFRPYVILGACNPQMAYRALQAEDKIGTMLPCNVVVQAVEGGAEVAAVDPVASMQAVRNEGLAAIATAVGEQLRAAVDAVASEKAR